MASTPHRTPNISDFARGVKVLLVDNDPKSLMHMGSILSKKFYRVTSVASSSIALAMIEGSLSRYDIVLADMDMPETDPFDFLKQIQIKSAIPVVLISNSEDNGVASRALNEGARFFFKKPVQSHNLINIWQYVPHKTTKFQFEQVQLQKYFFCDASSNKKFEHKQAIAYAKGLNICGGDELVSPLLENDVEEKKRKFHRTLDEYTNGNTKDLWVTNFTRERKKKSRDYNDKMSTKDCSMNTVEGIKRSKEDNEGCISKEQKARLIWKPQLEQRFREAIESLGEGATPKQILKFMDVPYLTYFQLANHLQYYRVRIKRQRTHECCRCRCGQKPMKIDDLSLRCRENNSTDILKSSSTKVVTPAPWAPLEPDSMNIRAYNCCSNEILDETEKSQQMEPTMSVAKELNYQEGVDETILDQELQELIDESSLLGDDEGNIDTGSEGFSQLPDEDFFDIDFNLGAPIGGPSNDAPNCDTFCHQEQPLMSFDNTRRLPVEESNNSPEVNDDLNSINPWRFQLSPRIP